MFALADKEREDMLLRERTAIERTLHILGQRRIDQHTTNIILACIRTIRKIDAETGVKEK